MGGAAIGVPALINAMVSKRAGKLKTTLWGKAKTHRFTRGTVHYQHLGEGPPVLLLHSLGPGHSSEEWRRVAELCAERFEIFAPDLLGWGRSDKPPLTYDGELYIELIAEFTQRVIRARPIVVAVGLPAAYVVQLAVDQAELFRGLALIGPTGIELHGDEPDFKDAMVYRLLRLPILGTSALNLYTSRSALTNGLRRDVFYQSQSVDDALIDLHYRRCHQDGSHFALAAFLSGYLNHSVRDIVSGLDLPVWLGWGRHAKSPAVESADLWLRQLANAELEVFENSGILPHAECPEEFCRRLLRFLDDLGD